MPDWSSLNYQQITSIGGAIGALVAAAYTAWRGYRSERRPRKVVNVPLAAIPAELTAQLDRVENRCTHIEHKVDDLDEKITAIHMDTQVLRDRKS